MCYNYGEPRYWAIQIFPPVGSDAYTCCTQAKATSSSSLLLRKILHIKRCRAVSSEAVAAGGGATDDKMDVSSPLPLKQTYLKTVLLTRGLWIRRLCYTPPSHEMESEAGTAAACSAQATTSGTACRTKRKQDCSPTLPRKEQKNARVVHLLEVPLNRL